MRCGGCGPRQMNSPLDWCWPLCSSQRCCCSDTSLLHSNVWSEEKGTGGSDHHSAQLPRHRLPTLTPTSTRQNQTWHQTHTRLSQLSVGWEESKLWGGGERYYRWLWGVWVKDKTGQFTCLLSLVATVIFSLYGYVTFSDVIYDNWGLIGTIKYSILYQYRHFLLT